MGTIVSGTRGSMADQRDEAVRKGAHCVWQIHDHRVFPVKYRKVLLDAVVTTITRETAAEIAERFPIEMDAMGMDPNHIHRLCRAHPNMAAGRIVQRFKRLTAREIVRRKPAGKRVLWGRESWTAGYYVAVVRYGQRQGQSQEDLRQLRMF